MNAKAHAHTNVVEYTSFAQVVENGFLLDFLFAQLAYYTNWNIILCILFQYTREYFDLHLSCLMVAFIAFSITCIQPKEYVVELDATHVLKMSPSTVGNVAYYGVDLAFHWLPLLLVFWFLPLEPANAKTCFTFFVIVIFMLVFDAVSTYKFNPGLTFGFACFAIAVRYVLGGF